MNPKERIVHERLKKLLRYNPENGELRWRVWRNNPKRGHLAGSIDTWGYRQIRIDGRAYQAHILVWFYVTGKWPTSELDHINCNKTDNRFENLRESSRQMNAANRPTKRTSKSGVKGVSFAGRLKNGDESWVAAITVSRKPIHLGTFHSKESASAAYMNAARTHFGEFARQA